MLKRYIQTITSFNPDLFPAAKFTGTNCFIIGSREERIMVDTGSSQQVDPSFTERLASLMQTQNFYIDKIFLTQGHIYHSGGTQSILDLHLHKNKPLPKVYKRIHHQLDTELTTTQPHLVINDIVHENFELEDGLKFVAIQTPGHTPDHMSYSL